ncbi:MAG: hypothetical protein A2W01_10745 [Candidatus Solincola sediminis]|uniref:Amidase domain-containing protein n=1 Tax=Candidatus Solincola sediminis TaxID=1797199 RepID=A0A1F2WMB2_9ACTN|nr:MAG: hypothetical protein A2Y75_12310 [Candidatus Solincola sediminis]OFW61380.1 MAG: hypothetical protein A2W01_10745 [Candidatus Solincola sediminis]
MNEVEWMSASELINAYQAKEVSPLEVTKHLFDRIEQLNPVLNAFVTLLAESAESQARDAEQAYQKGTARAMEGVPIAVKDNIWSKGIRTTYGSKLYEDFVPDEDAVALERMKGAGAIVLGKTNLPEFGLIGITENPLFGKTANPWDMKRVCGGSSGGSAVAVAAGFCPVAMGNDGAGSIRIPSALCGVFGIKPHFGRIPWYPHIPGFDTLNHEGTITRTVEDAALFLDVAAGPDRRDFASLPAYPGRFSDDMQGSVEGLRIAYSSDLGFALAVDSEVLELTRKAAFTFAELGCQVEEIDDVLPATSEMDFIITMLSEVVASNQERMQEIREVSYKPYMPFLDLAGSFTNFDMAKINFHRYDLWKVVRKIFEGYDLLLTPSTACPAFECQDIGPLGPPSIEGVDVGPAGWVPFTIPFNFTGQPAASVPCGFNSEGLPVGLQIVGDRFREALVLKAAAALERAVPWRQYRPPV